jgi:hypothetical protein
MLYAFRTYGSFDQGVLVCKTNYILLKITCVKRINVRKISHSDVLGLKIRLQRQKDLNTPFPNLDVGVH